MFYNIYNIYKCYKFNYNIDNIYQRHISKLWVIRTQADTEADTRNFSRLSKLLF